MSPAAPPRRRRAGSRPALLALVAGAVLAPCGAPALASPSAGTGPATAAPAALATTGPVLRVRPGAPRTSPGALARTLAPVGPPLSVWDVTIHSEQADPARVAAAEAAFRRAVQIWSGWVRSTVPIKVDVTFAPTPAGVLGATGPSYFYRGPGIGDSRWYYPSALADALSGRDQAAGTLGAPQSDIDMTLSSTEQLYEGTDGNPGPDQVDLETVVVHELAHGLGLTGSMAVDDAGTGSYDGPPGVYDTFASSGGTRVTDLPTPSRALGAALTSGAVTWTGRLATAANGGRPVPLWAPRTWEPGSSFSHLDEDAFPTGSADSLFTPYLSFGEVVHGPGPVVVGMLGDLGWQTGTAGAGDPLVSDIDLRYAQDPGLRAALGAPTGPEQVDGDVHWRPYQVGRLYSSPGTPVRAVRGLILEEYLRKGGHRAYGLPLTDELATPDGTGRFTHFTGGGSIYWTAGTGAHEVHGAIRDRWAASGWESGPLGYPTTSELGTPDGVGRFNQFSKAGSVYWSPRTGAHEVHGAIRERWAATGWEAGPAGYPTTDELVTADGGGRYNDFSRGATVVWSPASGAHEVHGMIRDRWNVLGGVRSYLRYPTSDELPVPGGRQNTFLGGVITWTPAGGARDRSN